jgi:hypothetical protein
MKPPNIQHISSCVGYLTHGMLLMVVYDLCINYNKFIQKKQQVLGEFEREVLLN